jgi:hypothetical protein
MEEEKRSEMTFGKAIDTVLSSLEPLDEATRSAVLRAVCDKLEIRLELPAQRAPSQDRAPEAQATQSGPASRAESLPPTDIRSFAQDKMPQSITEKVALVAYHLAEHAPEGSRKESINKEDIRKYFKQAGFPLPKRPEQALVNGLHAGYLERVEEGRYRLSPVGHNLVVHNLPRGQGERHRSANRAGRSAKHAPRRKNR